MGEVAVAAMVELVGAVFEIARRAGGVGEAGESWGESWVVESLVRDAGEAVVGVGVMGVMGESGASGGGVAHRGRFLEFDLDAAAGGVCDGLLCLVREVVAPQAAAGRPHTGVGWATQEQEDMASVHAAHDGGRHLIVCGLGRWRRVWTCVCERGSVLEGPGKEMLGKGQGKERACLLTRLGMCAGEGR